jgi:hypothetical protein
MPPKAIMSSTIPIPSTARMLPRTGKPLRAETL